MARRPLDIVRRASERGKNRMGGMTICVLGMHRSGTSCLTGVLEDAGVYLGNVSKHNRFNIKGNQEHSAIVDLHEAVYSDAGYAWDAPPSEPLPWTPTQRERLLEILAEFENRPIWAFKDPRTMFTLPTWLDSVPDLRLIGTFRHPLSVARSLHRRSPMRMPLEKAFALWKDYNEMLLQYQRHYGFPLVNFDLPARDYLDCATRALLTLGLRADPNSIRFFEPSLRNPKPFNPLKTPAALRKVYRELKTRAA